MSIRIDGTNTTANPGITGGDADTGLQFGTDEISFVTGGTNRATVESNGNLTIEDGNLVVAAGHGIDFSADANAAGMTSELLEDYEEGFFDPGIYATGGSATFSYHSGELGYVKIGRMVQITGRLQITRSGTAGGVLQFQLPFTVDSSMNVTGSPWMSHGSCFTHDIGFPGDSDGAPFFWELNTLTAAGWFYTRNNATWVNADPNLIPTGSNGYLTFSLTYRAAS